MTVSKAQGADHEEGGPLQTDAILWPLAAVLWWPTCFVSMKVSQCMAKEEGAFYSRNVVCTEVLLPD